MTPVSVTKREPAVTDPRKMDSDQLEALVREALVSESLSEYQRCALDEFMDREVDRSIDRAAKRDLQRCLKWQREVGPHREFARDYAKHVARISC